MPPRHPAEVKLLFQRPWSALIGMPLLALAACTAQIDPEGGVGGGMGVQPPRTGGTSGSPGQGGSSPDPVTGLPGGASADARLVAGPPRWGRLTAEQVRNTLSDLFGADLQFSALDPDLRQDGFATVGGTTVTTSEQGVERYTNLAFDVAGQVMKSTARRGRWVTCTPLMGNMRACAEPSLGRLGRLLFRRPVEPETMTGLVAVAQSVATETGDPWTGMEHALAAMLQSPRFLYTLDQPSSTTVGKPVALAPHALATRLALLLTNALPDEPLLDAAERGELATTAGLERQSARLMKLPQFRRAVRSFFAALWDIEQVTTRSFDATVLPKATPTLGASMLEETMRFLEHHLIDQGADFRAMLQSNVTFVNKELAAVYGITAPSTSGFAQVTLATSSRRHGLLTQGALLASHSSPKDSSPMLRGRMIQQDFLCRTIPDPPPDLMAKLPDAPKDRPTTKRQRLEEHRQNPACAACHDAIDPPGLAFETYDAIGAYRATENGVTIDPSGTLEGMAFADARGLATLLAASPAVTECFVRRLYRHASGRMGSADEETNVRALNAAFEAGGRKLLPLFTRLTSSEAFTHVINPGN